MSVNPLPFEYQLRSRALAGLDRDELAAALEHRDRELEDYLGQLAADVDELRGRVTDLETP